jgi:hypothetical protein
VLRGLSADLVAQIPPGERFARAARGWLGGVLAEVFPELLDGLRARPAKRARGRGPDEPGRFLGEITLEIDDGRPMRSQKFSEAKWERMLARLDESPLTASVSVSLIGADGRPHEGAYAGVRREDKHRRPDDAHRTTSSGRRCRSSPSRIEMAQLAFHSSHIRPEEPAVIDESRQPVRPAPRLSSAPAGSLGSACLGDQGGHLRGADAGREVIARRDGE